MLSFINLCLLMWTDRRPQTNSDIQYQIKIFIDLLIKLCGEEFRTMGHALHKKHVPDLCHFYIKMGSLWSKFIENRGFWALRKGNKKAVSLIEKRPFILVAGPKFELGTFRL